MLGAGIDALLPALREQAESMMLDSCTIAREASVWDEALQKTVTTWVTVHADVPCALSDPGASVQVLLAGETSTQIFPLVKIPVSFEGVEPDDRVTLASGPVLWVTDAPVRTQQVQRRLQCRWVK